MVGDRDGHHERADERERLVLRNLRPGGYRVRTEAGDERSPRVLVRSAASSLREPGFYDRQKIVPGYQYLTMRDGRCPPG
jgi:hypothetical protein